MTIEQLIHNHAKETPLKTALVQGDVEISYSQMWSAIEQVASWLSEKASRGDRVLIAANKDVGFVYTYFAAHLAGLIAVPVDPDTNEKRLNRIIEVAKPKLLIGDLRNSGSREVVGFNQLSDGQNHTFTMPHEDDIADIMFTTGTTGLPKGVALSYKNQKAAMRNINEFVGNTTDDVELLALPISHSFGLGRVRCVLGMGATLVLLGSFASMKKFYREIERCGVTGFGMVPASWAYILRMSGEKIGQYASQLKYIEVGSAFMPLENKHRLMSLLPDTRICMHYGLTEASRSAFLSFHDDEAHLLTVGKPSPNTEIAVFSEQGVRLGANEDGEIAVRGEHVCSAYWDTNSGVFEKEFFNGYFRTGDWGHIDNNGYLCLVSRKKEIINVGGKKVSPIEVEEVLNAVDGIKESACVGVHDDVLGEVVKAFCVCSDNVDFDSVKKLMTKKLEGYKIPAFFERISSLPKTHNGKIQRLLL